MAAGRPVGLISEKEVGLGSMQEQKVTDPHRQSNHELATELAERWVKQLFNKTWQERLRVIADLFEYMQESIGDFSNFCEVFPDTIAEIIYRLGDQEVIAVEQAHLYASSRDVAHRDAAGAWIRQHGAEPSSLQAALSSEEQGPGSGPGGP